MSALIRSFLCSVLRTISLAGTLGALASSLAFAQDTTVGSKFPEAASKAIEHLADLLEQEASQAQNLAAKIDASDSTRTDALVKSEAKKGSSIANILTSDAWKAAVDDAAHDSFTKKVFTVKDLETKSQSIADYADYLRGLSQDIRSAKPEEAERLMKQVYVPANVAEVIVAPRDGTSNPGSLGPLPEQTVVANRLLPLIVGGGDGRVTVDFPAVAGILYKDPVFGLKVKCTGTLIAANAVLTAAHCVQPNRPKAIFFQHAGVFEIDGDPVVEPHFSFPHADLAMLFLKQNVDGITPLAINDVAALPLQSDALIVGFGWHNLLNADGTFATNDIVDRTGLKMFAPVRTSSCANVVNSPKDAICWVFDGSSISSELGSTCSGDSGGPLIARINERWMLTGTTSGATTCAAGAQAADVEVFPFAPWIKERLAAVPPAAPAASSTAVLDPVTNADRYLHETPYRLLTRAAPDWSDEFIVGTQMRRIRIAVNATPSGGALVLKAFVKNTGAEICSARSDTAEVCEVLNPPLGPISVGVSGTDGQELQVVVTGFP